jgi:hypothetical protein
VNVSLYSPCFLYSYSMLFTNFSPLKILQLLVWNTIFLKQMILV